MPTPTFSVGTLNTQCGYSNSFPQSKHEEDTLSGPSDIGINLISLWYGYAKQKKYKAVINKLSMSCNRLFICISGQRSSN